MITIRHSDAKTFKTCPLAYSYRRAGAPKSLTSDASFEKTAWHDEIAINIDSGAWKTFPYSDKFKGFLARNVIGNWKNAEYLEFNLLTCIAQFHLDFRALLGQGRCRIIDWKRNPGLHSVSQLKWYFLALHLAYGVTSGDGWFWFYGNDRDFADGPHRFDMDTINETIIEVQTVAAEIEATTVFEGRPVRTRCLSCDYVLTCEETEDRAGARSLVTVADLEAMAARNTAQEARCKANRELMEAFMLRNGINKAGDYKLNFKPTFR